MREKVVQERVLPNFFIVGAPKAGTTTLFSCLNQNPDVFFPGRKELHYFRVDIPKDWEYDGGVPLPDEKQFLKLYEPGKNYKTRGDATVWYLGDPDTPTKIYNQIPNAKIVISLRHPVERMFSQYLHRFRVGREQRTFEDVIKSDLKLEESGIVFQNTLHAGFYSSQVSRWIEFFGAKNVKIIIFEEWIKKVEETLIEIEDFLEIRKFNGYIIKPEKVFENKFGRANSFISNEIIRKIGRTVIPRSQRSEVREKYTNLFMRKKPKFSEEKRHFLERIYYQDVRSLEKLLGRNLPWTFEAINDQTAILKISDMSEVIKVIKENVREQKMKMNK